MLLYFEDPVMLTGARTVPQPVVFIYPNKYQVKLECVSGEDMDQPVDMTVYGCDSWTAAVLSGYGTDALVLASQAAGA